jgi:hypothetical protein
VRQLGRFIVIQSLLLLSAPAFAATYSFDLIPASGAILTTQLVKTRNTWFEFWRTPVKFRALARLVSSLRRSSWALFQILFNGLPASSVV